MDVVPIEGEVLFGEVVAVNVEDGDEEALGREMSVAVNAAEIYIKLDVRNFLGIKDGFAFVPLLLLDELGEQILSQDDGLVQVEILLQLGARRLFFFVHAFKSMLATRIIIPPMTSPDIFATPRSFPFILIFICNSYWWLQNQIQYSATQAYNWQ